MLVSNAIENAEAKVGELRDRDRDDVWLGLDRPDHISDALDVQQSERVYQRFGGN
jgi:hypothetical protein